MRSRNQLTSPVWVSAVFKFLQIAIEDGFVYDLQSCSEIDDLESSENSDNDEVCVNRIINAIENVLGSGAAFYAGLDLDLDLEFIVLCWETFWIVANVWFAIFTYVWYLQTKDWVTQNFIYLYEYK